MSVQRRRLHNWQMSMEYRCGCRLNKRVWSWRGSLIVRQQLLQYFEPLIFLIILEVRTYFLYFLFHLQVLRINWCYFRLISSHLCIQEAESARICHLQTWKSIGWQLFVWLSELCISVGIGAVLSEVTLLVFCIVLTDLSLIIIVRNVKHFILNI